MQCAILLAEVHTPTIVIIVLQRPLDSRQMTHSHWIAKINTILRIRAAAAVVAHRCAYCEMKGVACDVSCVSVTQLVLNALFCGNTFVIQKHTNKLGIKYIFNEATSNRHRVRASVRARAAKQFPYVFTGDRPTQHTHTHVDYLTSQPPLARVVFVCGCIWNRAYRDIRTSTNTPEPRVVFIFSVVSCTGMSCGRVCVFFFFLTVSPAN